MIGRYVRNGYIFESYIPVQTIDHQSSSAMDLFEGTEVQDIVTKAVGYGRRTENEGYSFISIDIVLSSKTNHIADIKK